MVERQKTETTAEVFATGPEAVAVRMHRKYTELAPAEARQMAQELLDAAEEAEEFPTPPPVALVSYGYGFDYDELPTTPIPYNEGA
ncbi:hypothetical protein [Rathayibacter sp. VKM Ac-2630]|uniref:hypothetical protein n=1 Tax=Rathayibacter sp. VKM Ac-2630 TaxID=1938617 RepID=UPI0009808CC5|nr:hypothetical protein [Rathayibacter sp. VKM Ac-2630]OOB90724.1 hypothetical protein B0T42_09965 [Rathayibacter sp. VKM Ac-2630]